MAPQQYNVIVGNPENEHETAPRRNERCADAPITTPRDFKCNSVFEMVTECCKRYKNNNCIGWRTVNDVHEEKKTVTKTINGQKRYIEKTWFYYELAPSQDITFSQL